MAIPFRNPDKNFVFSSANEIAALEAHFSLRKVPEKTTDTLLLCSWNIANLGAQKRSDDALKVLAAGLRKFDLIAVQEVNEKYAHLAQIVELMGANYNFVMSDTAGNNERLAYIYDSAKVKRRQLFGELALRPREYPKHTVDVRYREGGEDKVDTFVDHRFVPFDRNPFIGSFQCGELSITVANTHLYFGKFQNSRKREERARYARRVLEIFALARWAGRRSKKDSTYDKDIILLGDMNVPTMDADESTYKALKKFGYQPLEWHTKTGGSNLGNDKTYDQMSFAPGQIRKRVKDFNVFDFDNALLRDLWQQLEASLSPKKARSKFNSYIKFHFSDHRPLWVCLDTTDI